LEKVKCLLCMNFLRQGSNCFRRTYVFFPAALFQELEAFNKGLRFFVFPLTILGLASSCPGV